MDADSVKVKFHDVSIKDIPTFFVGYCRSSCLDIDDFDEIVRTYQVFISLYCIMALLI